MQRDDKNTGSIGSTSPRGPVAHGLGGVGPGKRTLIEAEQQRLQPLGVASVGGSGRGGTSAAAAPAPADTAQPPGVWEHTFGEASAPVGTLGRVQASKGVRLRERPLPGAPSPSAP